MYITSREKRNLNKLCVLKILLTLNSSQYVQRVFCSHYHTYFTILFDLLKNHTVLFTFQVMVLGDSGVGKTCLLIRFRDDMFLGGNYISTVGVDFRVRSHDDQFV